ncbi:MAG: MogA/MoaB family molybdenum cofactor biosynthesis protein [Desulfobacteraceae bacterium]|jgi:molybdenum cofactor biosynthesis protein B|nr:MogA/MoaB family molybdenum cofactor biosynthesis protein [Desulfobacteraceae bacterium]MBC2753045.1 MogA/MoaB family molybdenum cofactor biosynthesis protein [Desulfobacteraceae bacterium]
MGTHEHKAAALRHLRVAILTVSTTRSIKEDKSGQWMARRAAREGHQVVDHRVVTDDAPSIVSQVNEIVAAFRPHALLVTGGTGIGPADVTIEAVRPLLHKELTAFGPLFAQLSYEEIDSSALLSRATAGLIEQTLLFCMPGSLNACKLACKALIFPELGHLAKHVLSG